MIYFIQLEDDGAIKVESAKHLIGKNVEVDA